MATSKTLTPTNVTIQIPEFTDQPDQRVNSNCIDKEADAINALNGKMEKTTGSGTTNTTYINNGTVAWSKTGKMVVVYFSDIGFSQGVSGNVELVTGLPKATDTVVFALLNYADNKAYRFRISNTATSAYAFYAGIPSGANLYGQCVYFTE